MDGGGPESSSADLLDLLELDVCPPNPEERNLGMSCGDPEYQRLDVGVGRIVVVLNPKENSPTGVDDLGLRKNEKAVCLEWEEGIKDENSFRRLAAAYVSLLDSVKSETGGLFYNGGNVYKEVVLEPLNDADPCVRFGNHVLALAIARISCIFGGKRTPRWVQFLEQSVDEALNMRWMSHETKLSHKYIQSLRRNPGQVIQRNRDWYRTLLEKEGRLGLRVHEQECTCGLCYNLDVGTLMEGGFVAENIVFYTSSKGGLFADSVPRANLTEVEKHAVASLLYLDYVCEPFRKHMKDKALRILDDRKRKATLERVKTKGLAAFGGLFAFLAGIVPETLEHLKDTNGIGGVVIAPVLGMLSSAKNTYKSRSRLFRMANEEYADTMTKIEEDRQSVLTPITVPREARLALPSQREAANPALESDGSEDRCRSTSREREVVLAYRRKAAAHLKTLGEIVGIEFMNQELLYQDLPVQKLKEWAQGFMMKYADILDKRRDPAYWQAIMQTPVEMAPTFKSLAPRFFAPYFEVVHMGIDDETRVISCRLTDKDTAGVLRQDYWDRKAWGIPSKSFDRIQSKRSCLGPIGLECYGGRASVFGFQQWRNTEHNNVAMVIRAGQLEDILGYKIGLNPNSLQLTRIGVGASNNYRWLSVTDDGDVVEKRIPSSGTPRASGRKLFRCIY